jgi:DUF4097 and DUF4098 domain-containing protein YvlB
MRWKKGVCALILLTAVLAFASCGFIEGKFKYRGDKTDVETFDLAGIDTVEMRLGSADVEIIAEDTGEAWFSIKKSYRATEKKYIDELLDDARVTIEKKGSTLIVERKSKRQQGLDFWTRGFISIDITAKLPPGIDLNINTGSGDVDIDDWKAPVVLHTGSGDVVIDGAAGGLDAKSGSGDLWLGPAGGDVTFSTGSGDIDAITIQGNAHISTGSGDLSLDGITGDLTISTGSGDIVIDESDGTAFIKTGSGDVTLGEHSGDAEILTSSGDVEFYVTADEGEVTLRTSSGDVDVVLYDGDSVELDIATSGGSITTKVPITVKEASRRRLHGISGDGAWKLTISTSSGDVSVRRGSI